MASRRNYTNTDILKEMKEQNLAVDNILAFCISVSIWELYQADTDPENADDHIYNSNWWEITANNIEKEANLTMFKNKNENEDTNVSEPGL